MSSQSAPRVSLPRNADAWARGLKVTLTLGNHAWLYLTPDEFADIIAADRKAGNFMDSAGESILYSCYEGLNREQMPCTVTVTSLRPKWKHYTRRPKGLTAGFCKTLNREVLFIRSLK